MTPWTVAYQAPPSLGFSRQEYWSGLPFPSPGDLPNLGIEPRSPTLQTKAFVIVGVCYTPTNYAHVPAQSLSPVQLCNPLDCSPPGSSPIPPSIRLFSNESTLLTRWPNYWSFSFNIIPSKEIPGLISFRMDWLDLLAVHGTLKSLLQHHSSKT